MNTLNNLQLAFSANTREESGKGQVSVATINHIALISGLIDRRAWAFTNQIVPQSQLIPEPDMEVLEEHEYDHI